MSVREMLGPRYHKVFYDMRVTSTVPITTQLRAEAALSLCPPGAYASHHTAALLWGGAVPDCADVHVTVDDESVRPRRQGVRAHVGTDQASRTTLRGIPVSTPLQTFLDLAGAGLDLVDLVVLGDSLVRRCRIGPAQLVSAAATWLGRGARRARRAARYVREGVDSPQESRLRMLIVLAGLPEPTVNLILRHPDGEWSKRFDLCYAGLRLIIEYDGRHHAESTSQWQHDLRRREQIDGMGWRLIVITADDLRAAPASILHRLADALRDRGATGIRRQFKTEWQRHFPSAKVVS